MTGMTADPVHPPDAIKSPSGLYTFRTVPFEYRDCDNWPSANKPTEIEVLESFPHLSAEQAEARASYISERFDRLQRGIKDYLRTGSLKQGLDEAKCSKEVFYRQFNRCLLPNPVSGEGIIGWAALIDHLRLKDYNRVSDGAGTAGIFQKWLRENQAWRELLHRMIRKGNGGEKLAARKPDVRGVTRNFIAAFSKPLGKDKQPKIPLGIYPHDGKSNARRAIERYVNRFIAMHQDTTAVWFGEDIADRQHLGTGPQSFNLAAAPFDVIGSDAHTLDCIGFIIIDGPSGPQKVPVTRFQLVVSLCHNKRLVTGYAVTIRKQIEARHVEEAYLMGNSPWKRKQLTIEGLSYAEGAGFPNGAVDGITEINPGMIRLDNAAQHYANGIRSRLRHSLACAIVWGAVGHWWRNAITERFFGTLERYGFQRLPSSMGTGTQDPHRAENPVLEATGKGIEWQELIQLIDVLLANYNAKPHSSLGGVSPLDSLRASISSHKGFWISRPKPPHTANSPRIGVHILRRRIAGSVEGRVPPYIEVGEIRYTATCLSSRYDLIGQKVYVHLPQDIRTIECFLDSGPYVGLIHCMDTGWSLSAHTYENRQAVNALVRKGEMWVPENADPMVVYLDHLTKKASASAVEHRNRVSIEASAVADLLLTAGAAFAHHPNFPAPANDSHAQSRAFKVSALPKRWE